MTSKVHIPVLLSQVLQFLQPKDQEIYLDCTFGAGGYSKAILETSLCSVIAIDQDPTTMSYAMHLKEQYGHRFHFYESNFANIDALGIEKVNGAVFDIGISLMQIKTPERGFSFQQDGPLDMRMNCSDLKVYTAKQLIDTLSEEDLAEVIYTYGEENNSRRIAKAIHNKKREINTTFELANVIRDAIGSQRYGKIDSATKTFQALRIMVNKELEQFSTGLQKVTNLLIDESRLVVVTFHSLEDRIAKNFFRQHSDKKIAKSRYEAVESTASKSLYKIVTKKPVIPTREEIKMNPSSRSAKLRAGIKIG